MIKVSVLLILFPDSILDELFPTLGDNASSNPLALLLNTLGSSDERGNQGTSLYNPFNLSPPRLHEIHAIATANLISQTQEAIMQEYNISEFDYELPDTESANHRSEEQTELMSSPDASSREIQQPLVSSIPIRNHTHDQPRNDTLVNDDNQEERKSSGIETKPGAKLIILSPGKLSVTTEKIEDEEIKSAVRNILGCEENKKCSGSHSADARPHHLLNTVDRELTNVMNKHVLNISESNSLSKKKCEELCSAIANDTDIPDKLGNCLQTISVPRSDHCRSKNGFKGQPYGSCNSFTNHLQPERNSEEMTKCKIEDITGSKNETKNDSKFSECNALVRPVPGNQPENATSDMELRKSSIILDNTDMTKIVFVCHVCYKQFSSENALDQHCQKHNKYVCPEANCVRTFVSRGHLQYHLQSHE